MSHEIKTAGGEGGTPVIETIRRTLSDAGELIIADKATTQEALLSLATLFFEVSPTPRLEKLRERFAADRRWPILEEASLLEHIVRAGVAQGHWCLFRMGSVDSTEPEHCFSRESGDLPLDLDLSAAGWALVTVQGARRRGWIGAAVVDPERVTRWVAETIAEREAAYVSEVVQRIAERHGEVPQASILDAVDRLVQADRALTYRGQPDQHEKPSELLHGPSAILHSVQPDDVIIAPAVAARRGWVAPPPRGFQLTGRDGAQRLVPLLPRIGGLYLRGARSTISTLDLVDLDIPGGGRLRLTLEDVPPDAMKRLGELFEVLATVIQAGPNTEGYVEIRDPDEQCPLLQALRRTPQ